MSPPSVSHRRFFFCSGLLGIGISRVRLDVPEPGWKKAVPYCAVNNALLWGDHTIHH